MKLPIVLLAVVCILISSPLAVAGGEGTVVPPSQGGSREAPPEEDLSLAETVDETHETIEKNILEQTVNFDEFFGGTFVDTRRTTGYALRWRNSLRAEEGGRVRPGTGVAASLVLSNISERLRLAISGEKEAETSARRLPQDAGNPGFDRTANAAHLVNTELRYTLMQTPVYDSFIGAGARVSVPFELFVRSRFQYTYSLSDVSLLRLGETFFLKSTQGLGETTELSLERLFSGGSVVRWAGTATASEQIIGLEWGSELSWSRQFSPQRALTLTGGVYGNTAHPEPIDTYRLLARYRQNFFRSWFFVELEPEVSWPWRDQYRTTFAFTMCIEVQFEGKVAARKETTGGEREKRASLFSPLL